MPSWGVCYTLLTILLTFFTRTFPIGGRPLNASDYFMQHFLNLADWKGEQVLELLTLARQLKAEWQAGGNAPLLKGKTLAMVFQKPSLRTRVSFEVGMMHLGGHAIMIGPDEVGLGKRESVGDVARALSRYVQGIMARVFAHADVQALAANASIPVINGLSDTNHPCQALADALTIIEHFGTVEGKRVAYIGDGNNVASSLGQIVAHLGGNFVLANPPGYGLSEEQMDDIGTLAAAGGGQVEQVHDPLLAVQDADVIYTDTWYSMGWEAEAQTRLPIFRPYQVNQELLRHAPAHAIVMHCLPAHRGQEITDEVADGAQSVLFDQAENRLHAQKAVLVKLMGA